MPVENDITSDLNQLAAALCRIEDRDLRERLVATLTALAERLATADTNDDTGAIVPGLPGSAGWSDFLAEALLMKPSD